VLDKDAQQEADGDALAAGYDFGVNGSRAIAGTLSEEIRP
jgi:hypothetical protein